MGCGCNNCNGTVSQNSQLPPGCDSILSITNENIGTEVIVTITFCSGAVQQFSIPAGVDGAPGQDGAPGADGADGADGEQGPKGEAGGNAYIIDHVGLDTNSEDNIIATLYPGAASSVLARSFIPATTLETDEDTIYFDVLINLDFTETLGNSGLDVFGNKGGLSLELNSSSDPNSNIGINLPLENVLSKIKFPDCTLKLSGEITRRKYTADETLVVQSKGSGFATKTRSTKIPQQSFIALDVIVEAESFSRRSYPVDNASTGNIGAVSVSNGTKNLAWAVRDYSVAVNLDNYLKIVGNPGSYTVKGKTYKVTATQIYFTTRYLQRK